MPLGALALFEPFGNEKTDEQKQNHVASRPAAILICRNIARALTTILRDAYLYACGR